MLKRKNKNKIIFTNINGLDFFPPKPAIKDVPDWYIECPEYISGDSKAITNFDIDKTTHTIKKCMPVFDAMTAGYILYTQVDVQVTQVYGVPYYTWPSQDFIAFHPISQAPNYPLNKGVPYAKFVNPYSIITQKGYSVLFTQPFHRNSIFTILPGIVDTDTYIPEVAFPFILNNPNWEGIIPAGTPMAQIIPFKRESWNYKIGSEKEIKEIEKIKKKTKTKFFNSYKKYFWHKKYYN
jgi:hypothetical protein